MKSIRTKHPGVSATVVVTVAFLLGLLVGATGIARNTETPTVLDAAPPTATTGSPLGSGTESTPSSTATPSIERQPAETSRARRISGKIPLEILNAPGLQCELTNVGHSVPEVAQTYGAGPVFATFGTWDGTISLDPATQDGNLYFHEVIWSVPDPGVGPILVRGWQTDGPGAVFFPVDGQTPKPNLDYEFVLEAEDPDGGTAFFPMSIGLAGPGCYVFQIDTLTGRDQITIQAVMDP